MQTRSNRYYFTVEQGTEKVIGVKTFTAAEIANQSNKRTIINMLASIVSVQFAGAGQFYGLTSFSFIYVFVYFLSILVVPYWIKCEKLHWGIKVLSVVVVFLISSLTMIFSVNGVYRDNLNFYFVLYAIVVGFSLIHCKKRKVECKK